MAARGGRFPPGGGGGSGSSVPLTMVRTKADGGGGSYRKVVAARAPRKVLGSGCANARPPPVTGKRAEGRPAGSNPVCVRPTPAWQRGIAEFLRRPRGESRAPGGEAAGSSAAARPAPRARPLPPDPLEDGSSSEEG